MDDRFLEKANSSNCDSSALLKIFKENTFVWARNNLDVHFSREHIASLTFKDKEEQNPIFNPSYRMKHNMSNQLNKQLEGMLYANWIEKYNSPWSFPIMGVLETGKTQLRIARDNRKLLVLPRFPIPLPSTLKCEIMHSITELKQFGEPFCFTIIYIVSL